jgi:hypothetical protein
MELLRVVSVPEALLVAFAAADADHSRPDRPRVPA